MDGYAVRDADLPACRRADGRRRILPRRRPCRRARRRAMRPDLHRRRRCRPAPTGSSSRRTCAATATSRSSTRARRGAPYPPARLRFRGRRPAARGRAGWSTRARWSRPRPPTWPRSRSGGGRARACSPPATSWSSRAWRWSAGRDSRTACRSALPALARAIGAPTASARAAAARRAADAGARGREALERADLVVVTGGASVGERDFAKAMFEDARAGADLLQGRDQAGQAGLARPRRAAGSCSACPAIRPRRW